MPLSSNRKFHYAVLVFVPVFALAFSLVLLIFLGEKNVEVLLFSSQEAQQPAYVQVFARVMSVDAIKGEMVVRLQFEPQGSLVGEDGVSPNQDLLMYINSATGKSRQDFPKDESMTPHDTVLDLDGGFWEYPFDAHAAYLEIVLSEVQTGEQEAAAQDEAVPLAIEFLGDVGGYSISASEQQAETGYSLINIQVERSTSVVAFAVLIMVLQWMLALCAFGVMVVWTRGRQFEVTMFGWMGALLFALIPLRNAMPSVPPVGVLSDFLSFYWSLIIISVSMVVSVTTWLWRGSAGRPK